MEENTIPSNSDKQKKTQENENLITEGEKEQEQVPISKTEKVLKTDKKKRQKN